MGILLKWSAPATGNSWTGTQIYSAATEAGTYSLVTTVNIGTYSYYHNAGTSSTWYKVRFTDSNNNIQSAYSTPLQGGDTFGYVNVDDVRKLTQLSSTDIADSALYDIIVYATAMLNSDIQTSCDDEKVTYINSEKENDIDGSNTTFYVRHPWIGDYNNDGEVDESDFYVYTINNTGARTVYTVTSLDNARIGKFTLSSAPTSIETLYVSYSRATVDLTTNKLVDMACIYLAAALATTKLDAGQLRTFRMGKVYVSREVSPYTDYMNKYRDLVMKIKQGKDMVSVKTDALV